MKRTIALVLVLTLSLFCFAACKKDKGNDEKTYSVAIATDSAVKNGKVTNTALVLVIDADNKIAAARFECAEVTAALNEDGTIKEVATVDTKVEQGDSYGGGSAEKPAMPAGSWAKQTKAYEDAIVGKTADEVANLDAALHAGCTMKNTVPTFKALVAKAFASTTKVTFKTTEAITTGIAIDTSVKNSKGKAAVSSDIAGVVMAGGKVAACMLDSVEQTFAVADGALVADALAVSKNDQGDSYGGGSAEKPAMPAGSWAKQAQAFANSAVGKTVAELANLETVSDALKAAGCTMKNTTAGYKATIIAAAGYAR